MIDTNQDVKPSEDPTSESSESNETTDVNNDDSSQEESVESNNNEVVIDYEAELSKLEESRLRAQETAKYERERRKKAEEGKENDNENKDDEKSYIEERVQAILRDQRQDIIDEQLEKLSEDKSERKLIEHIYDNRLNPKAFGFTRKGIAEALESAQILANLPRFKAQLINKAKQEAKKELKQEIDQKNMSAGDSTRREPKGSAQNLNAQERALLSFAKREADKSRKRN